MRARARAYGILFSTQPSQRMQEGCLIDECFVGVCMGTTYDEAGARLTATLVVTLVTNH